jgi:uncharacterized protein (TIGR03435 family)
VRTTVVAVMLLVSAAQGRTQSPAQDLSFEVAAIRRSTSESTGGSIGTRPGGRFVATNSTTRTLVAVAWGLPSNRVIGGPSWIATDRYVIEAISKENPTREENQQMLQRLLRERFGLVARVEKRDLPVYLLTQARPAGQLGPGLRRSSIDCNDPQARKKAAAAGPQGRIACGLTDGPGTFTGGGIAISVLEIILTSASGRPVLDRTGLEGGFDVDLKWTPTLAGDAAAADSVSIFTAVQEQLGLRLDQGTAPLDVIVIERIERPSEN